MIDLSPHLASFFPPKVIPKWFILKINGHVEKVNGKQSETKHTAGLYVVPVLLNIL